MKKFSTNRKPPAEKHPLAAFFNRFGQIKKPISFTLTSFGSPSWTRTNDTAVNSRVLYRLSYGGI